MINLKEIGNRAFNIYNKYFWRFIGYFMLVSLISIAFSYIRTNLTGELWILNIIVFFASLYVLTAIRIGLYKVSYKADDGEDFGISDLFSFMNKGKECLIVYAVELIVTISLWVILAVLGVILFSGNFASIFSSYPYISNSMMVNIMLSAAPKILLFVIIVLIVSLFLNMFPAMAGGIAAKNNERLSNNLFANTFSVGMKYIKYYVILNLWFLLAFLLICILFFAVSFIAVGSESVLGISFLPVAIISWIVLILLIAVYFSIAISVLFNRILNIEIDERYGFLDNDYIEYNKNDFTNTEDDDNKGLENIREN